MVDLTVDIDALIIEVRNRPPLYDTTNKEYPNRELKKQLWGEVCSSLKTADVWNSMNMKHKLKFEKEVVKKWNSLRTCFRRELRLNMLPIKDRKKRKYIYFDDLQYLLPFTKIYNDESMLDNDQVSDTLDISDEDISGSKSERQTEDVTDEHYEEPMMPLASMIKSEVSCEMQRISEFSGFSDGSSSINQSSHSMDPKKKRKRLTHRISSNNKSMHRIDDGQSQMIREDSHLLGNRKVSKSHDADGDEAFLSSLLPSLREFSSEEKLQLRIEILQTLLNFKKSINRKKYT